LGSAVRGDRGRGARDPRAAGGRPLLNRRRGGARSGRASRRSSSTEGVGTEAIFENLDLYWLGFSNTVRLLVITTLIALPAGVLLAAMRISPIAALRGVSITYVELLRNTPLTLVFFFMAFVLPRLIGKVDFEVGAIIALSLYTSAFF